MGHYTTPSFPQHRVDAVVHFAALKAVGESVEKPLEYYQSNVSGTLTLLQVRRFLFVQSSLFSSFFILLSSLHTPSLHFLSFLFLFFLH